MSASPTLHWLDRRYARLVLDELRRWRGGRQRRTTERVISEYRGRRMDPAQPVVAIDPEGQLHESTAGAVRSRNWRAIVDALAELGVRRGLVLEVGAGDGINLRGLRALTSEVAWIGCDLVPRDASIVAADATRLPFRPAGVDAVVTYNALEQMPRETSAAALREIARVARHGLVCVEPDFQRAAWPQRLSMLRKDYVRDIAEPATRAGLTLVRREWTHGGNPLNRPALFAFRR
jgi:SAM-dependent methyltransferase